MAKVHVILRSALARAAPEQHPPGDLQLGLGWPPPVAINHQIRIGLWCAEQVLPAEGIAPLAEDFLARVVAGIESWDDARPTHRQLLDRLRDRHRGGLLAEAATAHAGGGRYSVDPSRIGDEPPEVVVARCVAAAAATLEAGVIEYVHVGLSQAAIHATDALAQRGNVQEFLVGLDDIIMAMAFRTALRERAPEVDIRKSIRALWADGHPAHWVVRYDQHYGFLGKLGRRWRWVEGGRDEVLGTVPDALFESAVKGTLARDQGA